MTTLHVIDYYTDGYTMMAFCKVCSAEGDALLSPCKGSTTVKLPASHLQNNLDDLRDALDSNYDNG
jgi:hypothetical protein